MKLFDAIAITLFSIVLATNTARSEIPGGLKSGQFAPISVSPAERLDPADPTQAKTRLNAMGVKYLWRMTGDDIVETGSGIEVADFMGNAVAKSTKGPGFVAAPVCKRAGGIEKFLFIGRPAPDDYNGGRLIVEEKDSRVSRLSAMDSFTVGAWVKLMPNSLRDETGPGNLPGGFMALLTRQKEWIAQVTTERLYLNINRGHTGQNDTNQQLPWWAHTYGTCWNGRYSEECWHFVAVSFNPSRNRAQFLIVRREGNNLPGHTEDFSQKLVTSADLNKVEIPSAPGAQLLIGSDGASSLHGLLRGLFFARAELTAEQMKSIATFTAPSKQAVFCQSDDLKF